MVERNSKQTKIKAKQTKTAKAAKVAEKAKEFDFTGVPDEVQADLLEIEAECVSVARKNVAEVFHLGRRFAKAKQNLPNKYEEWVRKRCVGVTTRTASNYIAVHERFEDQKEKVIQLGLKSSALYSMASASEAAVAEIFGLIESGETLLGTDVTRVLNKHRDPAKQRGRAEKGGPKGLKEFVTETNVTAQKRWFQVAEELLAFLNEVYPEDSERLLVKKPELLAGLVARANWLGMELSRMSGCGFYHAADAKMGVAFEEIREWTSPTWKRLDHALLNVARGDGVPLDSLRRQIRDVVVPGLRWALGREAEGDAFLVTEASGTVTETARSDAADETSVSLAGDEEGADDLDGAIEVSERGEAGVESNFSSKDAAPAAADASERSVISLKKRPKQKGPTASEMSAEVANDAKGRNAEAS